MSKRTLILVLLALVLVLVLVAARPCRTATAAVGQRCAAGIFHHDQEPRGQNYESNTGSSDNITALAAIQGWPPATWTSLYARAEYQLRRLRELAAESDQRVILVQNRARLQRLLEARAADPGVVGAMHLIEGAWVKGDGGIKK